MVLAGFGYDGGGWVQMGRSMAGGLGYRWIQVGYAMGSDGWVSSGWVLVG